MEEPLPEALTLAHRIVALVRQADVSTTEQRQALRVAKAILSCYLDRAMLRDVRGAC